MATLILDIETVGEPWDELDPTTQHVLTRWLEQESLGEEAHERKLEQIKAGLGFSPYTGSIVAIGVRDYERGKSVVYYTDPTGEDHEVVEEDATYKPLAEADMLAQFWEGAAKYQTFVTFNGRSFDAPFLAIRSAIHGIRPSVDLMSNRYLGSQRGPSHVDLLDQLTFYSAVRARPNLHVVCRAFGIESPKADGVTGDDVAKLFAEQKGLEIARYNAGDLKATSELYARWLQFLRF